MELHRRFGDRGLSSAVFFPGSVATSFGSETTSPVMRFLSRNPVMRSLVLTSPEKGADTLAWLAGTRPGSDWSSGGYYVKRKPSKRFNPLAEDPQLARDLWEISAQLVR